MNRLATTFSTVEESARAKAQMERRGQLFTLISAVPGYARVGTAAVVVSQETRWRLAEAGVDALIGCGWVDYRPAKISVPQQTPPVFADDVFGTAAVVVLAPCVADAEKIRLIAHLSGDLTPVFPYLNSVMPQACYNRQGPTFTFLDGYRMVSLYPHRITIAKADEIVDAWRTLEAIRCNVNHVWARRSEIAPSYEMRERPPALEIFKRLPRTNCRACGETTCLAFAVKVCAGERVAAQCRPVFEGEQAHLKDALIEICKGLGVWNRKDGES